jgi:D-sedoheptulose 7-phosphate isomerase
MTSCVDENYRNQYAEFLTTELSVFTESMLALMDKAGSRARYFFAGNGASAAIASHLANDFSKALGLRASTFHDPAMVTCFGNDFGYANWIAEAVRLFGDAGDVVVLISSSGRSPNILNAAGAAKEKGMYVVSLTGPRPDADLVEQSSVSLQIRSDLYNIIECCHMIALCAVVDSRHTVALLS